MGCSSGKAKEDPVAHVRRRLSLGEVDVGPDMEFSFTEEDRAMLVQLSKQQVLDFVNGNKPDSRKFSVGSETDVEMQNARPSASKRTSFVGDTFNPKAELFGYACKKGLKPESPNQDSFFILKMEGQYSIYGVFDGHGRKGHDISNFVKDNLPKILLSQPNLVEDPLKALEVAFEKTQILIEQATNLKKLDALRSGTTASVVFHDLQKGILYMAHVGDSRVVLGRHQDSEKGRPEWTAVNLTLDHKPDLPEERARIEKAGGMVIFDGGWNYRVYVRGKRDARGKRYPGLNMSRSMGDMAGSHDAGISAVPDINQLEVTTPPSHDKKTLTPSTPSNPGEISQRPDMEGRKGSTTSAASANSKPSISSYNINRSADKFVLLCSDGVWEFIRSEEAAAVVGAYKRENAMEAAENLAGLAWKRWMSELGGQVVDDITALIVHLT